MYGDLWKTERTRAAERALPPNYVCPRRNAATQVPGRVPADGPYRGEGAPRPLNLHFLLTIFVPYADDPIEHPQSQVLTIIRPAAHTSDKVHEKRKGNRQKAKPVKMTPWFKRTSVEATVASYGAITPDPDTKSEHLIKPHLPGTSNEK